MSLPLEPSASAGRRDQWLDRIGLFGVHLFALFAVLGISVAVFGMLLFVCVFFLRFRDWQRLGRDPMVILCSLLVLYVGLHSFVYSIVLPAGEMADDIAETGISWAKLTLFIPFAYWAGGDPHRIRRLLLLLFVGFTIGFLRKIDWAAFDPSFFESRFDDYLPPNAFGMFAALGTLGLIIFRERFYRCTRGVAHLGRFLVWGLLLVLFVQGLLLSFSRGSWLAFFVAAVVLSTLEMRHRQDRVVARPARSGGASRRAAAALPVALGALLALLIAANWDSIKYRLVDEVPVVVQVLRGDFDRLQHRSIGIRLLGWRFGVDEWRRHPWLGLGAGSSRHRIAASERPELLMYDKYWLPHLHNTYIEILYQLGLVGLILLASIVWVLARSTGLAYRAGLVPRDLYLFLLVTLVFVLLWNLFEYRAVRHDWRFFWIIVAGSAYSFHLRSLLSGMPEAVSRAHAVATDKTPDAPP